MRLGISKISGVASDGEWAYVHVFECPDFEKRAKRGELVVALSVSGVKGVQAVAVGREILTRLNEEYYGNLEGGALEGLKRAVAKVVSETDEGGSEQLVADEEGAQVVLEVMGAAFVEAGGEGRVAYLVGYGGGEAWARKTGVTGKVFEGGEGIKIASGRIGKGEAMVLGTKEFFGFSKGRLKAILMKERDEAAESLAPIVEGLAGAAGAVVGVEAETEIPNRWGEEEERVVVGKSPGKGWTMGLGEKIKGKFGKKPTVYVGERGVTRGRNGKAMRIVAVVLLMLLGVSVGFGRKQVVKKEIEAKFGGQVRQVEAKLREAQELLAVNPGRARQLLVEARDDGERLIGEGYKGENLAKLVSQVGEVLGAVSGEVSIAPKLFADLSLVREGMEGTRMAYSGDKLFVVDSLGGRLVTIETSGGAAEVVAGGDKVKGGNLVAGLGTRGFVFTDGGVVEADAGENKTTISTDEQWGDISAMVAYGGNIYLLDKGKNTVWRYPGIEQGFGVGKAWLGEGVEIDLSKATDMAIDGSIWVVTESGKIAKMTLGVPEGFEVVGLDRPMNIIYRVETSDEADNVYLLDRDNKRVVVIKKEKGEYEKQYKWEEMGKVSDISVDEKGGKLYLLSGSKIWVLELK